uniref:Uncharacterized protein n=1 Tax=Ditylenchus dipsaci TaxID=166011 RepID=A0A915D8G6_9BILA
MKTALRNHHLMEPCYRWYEYDPKEKPYKSLALINYSQCTHVIVSLINDKTSRNTVIDIPEDFPVQIKSILAQDGPHGDKKPFYFFRVSASQYMGHVRQQLIDEGYGDHLIHPTNDDFGANKSPYQNSPFEQITALIQQAHISHFDGLEFEILPIFPDNQPDKYYYLIYDAEFDFIMAKYRRSLCKSKKRKQIDGLDYVGINFGPPTSLVPFFVTTDTNFPLHWWVPHNYNVGALLYVLNAKFGFKIIALYNKYPERIYFDDLADDVKATDQFKEFKHVHSHSNCCFANETSCLSMMTLDYIDVWPHLRSFRSFRNKTCFIQVQSLVEIFIYHHHNFV